MREAFSTVKYFIELEHPGAFLEENATEEPEKTVNNDIVDVEAELLKEAKTTPKKKMLHIYETGVAQAFFKCTLIAF